ncbi:MAG: hypothetical protein IJU52_05650 [Clostridia bacterium]|nr:hypothetical protein [Clostridia bacterium]
MATFTNKATLTYNGVAVDSNTVTGKIEELLEIYKTAQTETYATGPVTYTVTLVNNGLTALENLTLTDDLGAYEAGGGTVYPLQANGPVRYFLDGVPKPDPAFTSDAGLVISGISLPAGSSAAIVYTATPTEFAPRDGDVGVTNTVTATGAGLAAPVSAQATVLPASGAVMAVYKSVTPDVVGEDAEISYAFIIENSGVEAVDPKSAAVLSDVFTPILHNIAVTLDGTALSEGTGYTYDESTGEFSTVPGVIDVPAATVTQDPATGAYTVVPGSVTLTVTGTIA